MKIDPKLLTKGTGTVLKAVSVNASALAECTGTTSRAEKIAPTATDLSSLSEAAWHEMVVGLATANLWEVAHCRKVLCKNGERTWWETTMPSGWPDLFLARGRASCFWELKVGKNTQDANQKKWQKLLEDAGHKYEVIKPSHWPYVLQFLTAPLEA